MLMKHTLATGLMVAAAGLACAPVHAAEAAKDPKTGKNCVTFMSSELDHIGQTRMNYRNVCASSFEIRILARDNVRRKTIEAGSAEKPSKIYITCKPDDRCEAVKWEYE